MVLVIGGVLLLVLVAGVGGFFIVNSMRANSPTGNRSGDPGANKNSSIEPPSTTREVGRYWLEISAKAKDAKSVRVAPMVPVASGQLFKFHFTPSEDGYLYIVGPGPNNALTAFLTAKPPAGSGLSSNSVKKGVDFTFPSGGEQWLELDKNPGTEDYTLIFSPTLLPSPGFLNQEAKGQPLGDTEKMELTALLAKSKTSSPVTESTTTVDGEPFVTLKLPVATAAGNPLVFDVRIQHR